MPLDIPAIDYTSRDYASIRKSLLDDALKRVPEWTNRAANDFGVMLVEEFAYLGDIVAYYTDRLAAEAYLPTARQRSSILNIAGMLGYRPDNGQPSTVELSIGVVPGTGRIRVPAGSKFSTAPVEGDLTSVVIFETDSDLYIDQNAIDDMHGTVSATQGETVNDEVLGLSDGTPLQVFQLLQSPVIEQSVIVKVDEGSGPVTWVFYEHLIDAAPTALAYTTRTDAIGRTTVHFGDDVSGRVPFNGAAVTVTYRVGGGAKGNVGAGTITAIVEATPTVSGVNNLGPATGGTDPETNDQIRVNAPRAMSTLLRAVSLEDYGNICFNVAGVAKASADALTMRKVTVYIAPSGGGMPTEQLKQRVLAFLQAKKVGPSAQIIVTDPVYVPVNIGVEVMVKPQYAQAPVINTAKNALIDLLSFANVDFGMSLSVSDVYAALTAVEGVQFVLLKVLARSSDAEPQAAATIDFKPNEIPTSVGGIIAVTPSGMGGIVPPDTGSGGTQPVVPTQPGAPIIDALTCPVAAAYDGAFDLAVHWAASEYATGYQVVMDFFLGTTYRGSFESEVTPNPQAAITAGFVTDADTVKIRAVALNGNNKVDGPTITTEYLCGSNVMAPPPGTEDLPTGLAFTSMVLGSQDSTGRTKITYALGWANGATPPDLYTYEIRFLDTHGTVMGTGLETGVVASAGEVAESTPTQMAPAGAKTMQYRLGVRDASGTVVKWTDWVGASVQVYVPPLPQVPQWSGTPSKPVVGLVSWVKNANGTVTFTVHVDVQNAKQLRVDWRWSDNSGHVGYSANVVNDERFLDISPTPGNTFSNNITITTTAPTGLAYGTGTPYTPRFLDVWFYGVSPAGMSAAMEITHAY